MQFFNYKGYSIHYRYLPGAGDRCFLFANSLGTDFRIWDDVVSRLQPYGAILCFDKPGHGLSVSGGAWDVAAYASLIIALLDAHGIQRCVCIGLSIGGLMGQYLALHQPQRLECLVLSNTAACIGQQPYWDERIAQIEMGGTQSLADMILGRWLSPGFIQTQPSVAAGLKRMLESCATPGYIQACKTLRDTGFADKLSGIHTPVLCIAGSVDAAVPLADMQALADAIAGAQLCVLEGVGHLPCVEVPGDFAAAVIKFVVG